MKQKILFFLFVSLMTPSVVFATTTAYFYGNTDGYDAPVIQSTTGSVKTSINCNFIAGGSFDSISVKANTYAVGGASSTLWAKIGAQQSTDAHITATPATTTLYFSTPISCATGTTTISWYSTNGASDNISLHGSLVGTTSEYCVDDGTFTDGYCNSKFTTNILLQLAGSPPPPPPVVVSSTTATCLGTDFSATTSPCYYVVSYYDWLIVCAIVVFLLALIACGFFFSLYAKR